MVEIVAKCKKGHKTTIKKGYWGTYHFTPAVYILKYGEYYCGVCFKDLLGKPLQLP
jgi:hypothetical protein